MTATPAKVTLADVRKKRIFPKGGKLIHRNGVVTVLDAAGKTVTYPEYSADEKAFIADRWAKRTAERAAFFAANPSIPKPGSIPFTGPKKLKNPVSGDTWRAKAAAAKAAGQAKLSAQLKSTPALPPGVPSHPLTPVAGGQLAWGTVYDTNCFAYVQALQYGPIMPPAANTGPMEFTWWMGVEPDDESFVLQPIMEYDGSNQTWALFTEWASATEIINAVGTANVSVETTQCGYYYAEDTDNTYFIAWSEFEDETAMNADVGPVYMDRAYFVEEVFDFNQNQLPATNSLNFTDIVMYEFSGDLSTNSYSLFKNNSYVLSISGSGNNPGSVSITNLDV